MGSGNIITAVLVSFVIALGAEVMAGRFSRRALVWSGVAALLAATVYGTFVWLNERPHAHAANATVSQSKDWVGHATIAVVVFAMPVLVGLGTVAVLPGARLMRPFRFLATGAAVFGSLYAAIALVITLGAVIYRRGP